MKTYFYKNNPWWKESYSPTTQRRDYYCNQLHSNYAQRHIQLITGLRRVGKTTIVKHFIADLINIHHINPKTLLWFSADEPSITNRTFLEIINEFRAEFNHEIDQKITVFIDEVQFRPSWVQEIKSLYDTENIKFVLTGSSALLLMQDTHLLTGRYLPTHVYPLTFQEFLRFKNLSFDTVNPARNSKYVTEYLQTGGMPEQVLHLPENYLRTTVESILFRDVVASYNLRNADILDDLLHLYADRVSSQSSRAKLANIIETSKDLVIEYSSYLKQVFLVEELPIFSSSRNKRIYNPDKIYFSDIGILNAFAQKYNQGAVAENAVFTYLQRQLANKPHTLWGYWYENKSEIDFYIQTSDQTMAIEVKQVDTIDEIDFSQLKALLKTEKPTQIIYVTRSLEGEYDLFDTKVTCIPLYVFLHDNYGQMS